MARLDRVQAAAMALSLAGLLMGLSPGAASAQSSASAADGDAQDMPDFPIPSAAGEAYSPIGEGFASPIKPRADLLAPKGAPTDGFTRPWRHLQNTGPFFRDTELSLTSRSFWFNAHEFDGREVEALTTGGYVTYESGYAGGVLQLRGVAYTSQPLYAPDGAGRSLNLTLDGDQITTLGQANARLKLAGQELSAGRQLLRTAFLNPKDNRMIPLTFEGIVLVPERRKDLPLDYIASYLWRYKPRNTDDFISFSEPFFVREDEGMLISGIRHRSERFNYGLVNYWIKDTVNTAYAEADYLLPFGGDGDVGPTYRVSINDLDQRSVGADLIPGPSFDTYQASVRLISSYRGFVLTTAGSTVGKEADVRDPFGNFPVYTSLHQVAFERAGENAYVVTLSYDFTRLGIEGLKVLAGWGQGFDAINPRTRAPEPDRDVFNLRLEYEPESGPLQGLQVHLYYADQRLLGAALARDDQTQFRAIVNYSVPLL